MTSTFHSLETARRALAAQQSALMTTGHNIANANTPGYTRQRVNLETTTPYPGTGINRPQIPGNIGTGVQVGNVQRIRDSFVDTQYRTESSKLGYWEAKAGLLSQVENIMNEPSETGLANTMDRFWSSLQDLATQPQDNATRAVVRQTGIALADTFNYIYSSLQAVQQNYRNQIDVSEQNLNSIIRQINQVNKQIGSVEPHGLTPNDLYDERDRLVDELSSMANIKLETKSSGGNAANSAEGLYDIYLATPEGEILKDSSNPSQPIKLIDAKEGTAFGFHIQYENRQTLDSPVSQIKFFQLDNNEPGFVGLTGIEADTNEATRYSINDLSTFNTNGKLRGFIEGYGYQQTVDGNPTDKGMINEMLAQLDTMAHTFATQFNLVHGAGWSPNGIHKGTNDEQAFFSFKDFDPTVENVKGAAARIMVSNEILTDLDHIAAAEEGTESSDEAFIGNGSNALKLAEVKDAMLNYNGSLTNVQSYYQGIIGELGDQASEANRMTQVAGVLQESVEQSRMSISSVSLDEEMADMITFQHAYNAAARYVTLVDEMLDKIINGMGVVGR